MRLHVFSIVRVVVLALGGALFPLAEVDGISRPDAILECGGNSDLSGATPLWIEFAASNQSAVAPDASGLYRRTPNYYIDSQPQAQAPILSSGRVIERELKGGEAQEFTVSLQAGQFMQVDVEQWN